jgi:hypothetical protein
MGNSRVKVNNGREEKAGRLFAVTGRLLTVSCQPLPVAEKRDPNTDPQDEGPSEERATR